MATLHANRKVTAHMPDGQDGNKRVLEKKEATSRSSLLEQAFQKMNQATFEALTFQEFTKEFPLELVRENQSFLRDLHSQLINISSSAIQVINLKSATCRFLKSIPCVLRSFSLTTCSLVK
jgi:hypothetical protein